MVSLYLDSAERHVVTPLIRTGLFAGVTTNPSILAQAGLTTRDVPDVIDWALQAGAPRIFAQAPGRTVDEILDRAAAWRALSDRVVIKVVYSPVGIAAARRLSPDGPVLVTALHRADQTLPVIATGASYAAPFIARMDAGGRDGITETLAMQTAVTGSGASLHLLAGSVRNPAQILRLVQGGIRHVTFAPAIWDAFFTDELTHLALDRFDELTADVAEESA